MKKNKNRHGASAQEIVIRVVARRQSANFYACAILGRSRQMGGKTYSRTHTKCEAGKNPRAAIAKALHAMARAVGGRGGAFAGLK